MPVLTICLSARAHAQLELASKSLGRPIEDLAEAAVEDAALRWDRDQAPRAKSGVCSDSCHGACPNCR